MKELNVIQRPAGWSETISRLIDLISGTEHLFTAMLIINLTFMYISSKIPTFHTVERIWCFLLLKSESKLHFCWFWSFWFDESNIIRHQLSEQNMASHVTSDWAGVHFLLVSSWDDTNSDNICNKLKCETVGQLGTEAAPSRTCGESLQSNWANNYRSVSIHATTLSDRWLLWSV